MIKQIDLKGHKPPSGFVLASKINELVDAVNTLEQIVLRTYPIPTPVAKSPVLPVAYTEPTPKRTRLDSLSQKEHIDAWRGNQFVYDHHEVHFITRCLEAVVEWYEMGLEYPVNMDREAAVTKEMCHLARELQEEVD